MTMNFDIMALTLILPALGALLIGTMGRQLGKTGSALLGTSAVGASFLAVLASIYKIHSGVVESTRSVDLWHWASIPTNDGAVQVGFGLYLDPLSLTLMSVVTGVGFLIHCFSVEYMKEDPEYVRFFCLLNVFITAMSLLVLANNFATLIIGWGGVGFASFALIGFWREKPSAAAASKKAFVMNVVGDVGLMVAVFILFHNLGSLDYQTLFLHKIPQISSDPSAKGWVTLLVVGLMVGAYAKSAQLPLHTWLPDAMEGPTPVSALIHAATMVTAGVYLLVRCHPILELVPSMMQVIATMGAVTALFAACCAMVQTDLKRVLAYSTMSQLGYMFLAVGVGAYGAAVFHLITHAFFKALLFLTAGMVIHTAHGEQDMRKLGGLRKDIPFTCFMFAVGGACLAGLPPMSGFFSKEAILHAAHHHEGSEILFLIGGLVALMTAFYTGRAFFMTFFGKQNLEHPHLPGGPTTLSCFVLTVLAFVSGGFYERLSLCFDPTASIEGFKIEPAVSSSAAIGLTVLVAISALVAMAMYAKGQEDKLGRSSGLLNWIRGGFGFDKMYGILASGTVLLARFLARAVDKLFSSILPDALGKSFSGVGNLLKESQTGYTRHYMASIVFSGVMLLVYALVVGGGFFR